MQVTIDTRHDTLEEALAVITLAFAHAGETASAGSARPGRTGTKKTAAKRAPSPRSAKETAAAVTRAPAGKRASRIDRGPNIAPPGQADVVRAWARAQGMHVKPAGRLSAAVVSAYNAAH